MANTIDIYVSPAGADSNPYGVLAASGGAYSTDAGGNDLLFTDRAGRTRTVAVFPDARRSTASTRAISSRKPKGFVT